MSLARLKDFLDSQNIKYVTISHSVAYTAQGIAALTHTPGKELAKTVIVKLDGSLAMAVVPASSQVDFSRLRTAASATHAVLASEQEFKATNMAQTNGFSRMEQSAASQRPSFGPFASFLTVRNRGCYSRPVAEFDSSHSRLQWSVRRGSALALSD